MTQLAGLSLQEIAALADGEKLPPVHLWNPPDCGESAIRILADGRWIHAGSPINRPELVRLFASIMRRDPDGRYWLVTPVERQSVEVEDAPFVAVEVMAAGEGCDATLGFRLNTGGVVIAGPDHPLRFADGATGPKPYLHVRGALAHPIEARIARSVYYELAERALAPALAGRDDPPGLWSRGMFFPMASSA